VESGKNENTQLLEHEFRTPQLGAYGWGS